MTGNKIITVHSIRQDAEHIKQKEKLLNNRTTITTDILNTLTVQPNLPVFFKRASLAVFVSYALLNIAEHRLTPLCKSNKIYTKERNYEIIF